MMQGDAMIFHNMSGRSGSKLQQTFQILAVIRLGQQFNVFRHLILRNPARLKRYFVRAADPHALTILDRADVIAGVDQAIVSTSVKPSVTSTKFCHGQ